MCLELTKNSKEMIADKVIPCFKVVLRLSDEVLITPYQDMIVEIGKDYQSILMPENWCKHYIIREGFHSFVKIEAAKLENKYWENQNKSVIVECEIPIGSKYYLGHFDIINKLDSYASDSIKYIKIVE